MPFARFTQGCFKALALACACTGAALAQLAPPFDENSLRTYVSQQVASSNGEGVTRFDVKLGIVEAQPSWALCRRTEPFTPAGARFWGRSSLGVRCVDGATWSVLLPVTVTIWGHGIVAANPLLAGAVLMPQDLRDQEIELTREAGTLVRDVSWLTGRTLTRAVNAGQTLRPDMVRTTSVVQAGDAVRLRLSGPGFTIAATGQALNNAGAGESVRVKTELGKIVTGTARDGRQVDLAF